MGRLGDPSGSPGLRWSSLVRLTAAQDPPYDNLCGQRDPFLAAGSYSVHPPVSALLYAKLEGGVEFHCYEDPSHVNTAGMTFQVSDTDSTEYKTHQSTVWHFLLSCCSHVLLAEPVDSSFSSCRERVA